MPRQPVHFQFAESIPAAGLEAACRRRLRWLENTYPWVGEWSIAVSRLAAADGLRPATFETLVTAGIVGGEVINGHGSSSEALGALRLALNAIEEQLQSESDQARNRATEWLGKVKSRLGPRWAHPDD